MISGDRILTAERANARSKFFLVTTSFQHQKLSIRLALFLEVAVDGRLAVYCNLEEERKSNRKFLMLETRGDQEKFAAGIGALGCEYAITGDHRVKVILQGGIEVRDLYRVASQHDVQIRRLSYKRDSLEDIFLKAMENGHGGL